MQENPLAPGPTEGTSNDPRLPRVHLMTIVAQDLSMTRPDGGVLLAQVPVPAVALQPGPRGHRFHVVDYDLMTGDLRPPVSLTAAEGSLGGWSFQGLLPPDDEGRLPFVDAAAIRDDWAFHAQNIYAIAARTLAAFEFALGRRLPWAFRDHQLFLVPHGLSEANAYYTELDHAVLFGSFFDAEQTPVHTCLSHDIVVHETTHAILDGLRSRFDQPALPDQDAFHEGFADVVALLSVFSVRGVIEHLLGEPADDGTVSSELVAEDNLRDNALFKLAEEMGSAITGERGSALRRSVDEPPPPDWRDDPAYEEPHRRGEVLVAALMETVLRLWVERLQPLIRDGRIDLARTAEEGRKAAEHLLTMAIRAIDYSPAVELEFEDYLAAIIWGDTVVAPEDGHHYRDSVRDAFSRLGILMNGELVTDLSTRPGAVVYQNLNFAEMHNSRDEVFAFVWNNAEWLGIDRRLRIYVDTVKPAVRIGPDGLVIHEIVADYVQTVAADAAALAELGLELPSGLGSETQLEIWGGGTVIFDQFGRAKLHISKPLSDWGRQKRRLDYLVRTRRGTRAGFGSSLGTPLGQRFAAMHVPRSGEQW